MNDCKALCGNGLPQRVLFFARFVKIAKQVREFEKISVDNVAKSPYNSHNMKDDSCFVF